MTERNEVRPGVSAGMLLAVVLGVGLICLTGFSIWMAGSSWKMRGHMGRMMDGGRNTSNAPLTTAGASASVSIRDFEYAPGNLQVAVGATVTWTNDDAAPHTATAKNRDWDTGRLSQNESGSVTFRVAGEYTYYCSIHPSMIARLVVK